MLSEFEKKVANFIKANELFGSADRALLAISGGADSMALLHAMCALKTESIFDAELLCAHMNHQLRGSEADLDEDFVIALAGELKLSITTKRLDVRGFAGRNRLSIETAARKLRIESLLAVAKANKCNRIVTAHQKNDNAETILQRLSRGTAFRGLGGIWPIRVFAVTVQNGNPVDEFKFVRPLLCVRRDEIIDYLQERNLKWRQDHTNADCTYRRNYIRHRLLPTLQQDCTGSVVEQLSKLAQSARKFYSAVCSCADKVWPEAADCAGEKTTLDLKIFLTQPEPVKVELVRRSLTAIGSGERDLTRCHYERILQLAEENASRRKIQLPNRFVVQREYGSLIFGRAEEHKWDEEQISESKVGYAVHTKLKVPGQTTFCQYLIKAAICEVGKGRFEEFQANRTNLVECFDFDRLTLPLLVRFRAAGDRFIPLGLHVEKKVGKFLTAARIPQEVRRRLLIIADREKIIYVWPIRISEQAKVTGKTRKILRLQIADSDNI